MQYNVSTAKVIVAAFFAFCCTGKVCIDSFLTVFLRHMGFTPFQAGIFRCLQSFTGGASIIGISYCTGLFQKRFSWAVFILVSIICYLLLLISSLQYPCFYTPHPKCSGVVVVVPVQTFSSQNAVTNVSSATTRPSVQSITTVTKEIANQLVLNGHTLFINEKRTDKKFKVETPIPDRTSKDGHSEHPSITQSSSLPTTIVKVTSEHVVKNHFPATTQEIILKAQTTESTVQTWDDLQLTTSTIEFVYHSQKSSQSIEEVQPKQTSPNNNMKQLGKYGRTGNPKVRRKNLRWSAYPNISQGENDWYQQDYKYLKDREAQPYDLRGTGTYWNPFQIYYNPRQWRRTHPLKASPQKRPVRLVNENLNQTVHAESKKSGNTSPSNEEASSGLPLATTTRTPLWPSYNLSCLFVVLGLMLLGEFASSPTDKMADESWYQYLDEIDYIERYDQRMSGVSIMTTLTLMGIVLTVAMYCASDFLILPAYHLHFYTFVLFWTIIFFLGYFFPYPMNSGAQSNSLFKGMAFIRYMCRNGPSALVLITVIVCGSLHGCMNDFLLWYMEDLGASEFTTTSAVVIAVASEIFPQFLAKYTRIFRRTSLSCMFSISVFTYSIRFGLIAALWIPWAIAATQVLHCLSSCVFWMGIHGYVTRLCFQGTNRSVLLILNLIYHHVGRPLGSSFGGLVYSVSKPQILFWCLSGISLLWGILFCMLHNCSSDTPRGRLSKSVLSDYRDGDHHQLSSLLGDEDEEEDWLEAAIKVDKHKRKQ